MTTGVSAWVRERIRLKKSKPIPAHMTFFHCFGGLSFSVILLQLGTGIFMLFFYNPEPQEALKSIDYMSNEVVFGGLFRNVHRWASVILLAMVFSHMTIVFYYKAYRSPRELTWISGVVQLLVVFLFIITGIILPWDWRAYWAFALWMDYIETWPLIGEYFSHIILDGFSINIGYFIHILMLPVTLAVLLYLHFRMVRKHGISEPL
jgi:quinol-cytochrome oxidoreductase complex cytochrome b subunit